MGEKDIFGTEFERFDDGEYRVGSHIWKLKNEVAQLRTELAHITRQRDELQVNNEQLKKWLKDAVEIQTNKDEQIDKLTAELDAARKWHLTLDRVPEQGELVQIGAGIVGFWLEEEADIDYGEPIPIREWYQTDSSNNKFEVMDGAPKYWRPLPQPPNR